MEATEAKRDDLLTRTLANRWMRTLIVIAIFLRVVDVYCDAGMSFYLGFQAGLRGGQVMKGR